MKEVHLQEVWIYKDRRTHVSSFQAFRDVFYVIITK